MYETTDAFTKYLPAEYAGLIKYVEVDGRTKIAVNGLISNYIPNPTFEVVAAPGAQEEYFKSGNPEGKSRRETSARCLTCHGEAHEQSHFAESSHSSSDIGCLDCHSPHHAKEKEFLLVQEQPQLCYGCHT